MKYPLHTHYSQKDKRRKWGEHGGFHFKQRVKSQENLKDVKIEGSQSLIAKNNLLLIFWHA